MQRRSTSVNSLADAANRLPESVGAFTAGVAALANRLPPRIEAMRREHVDQVSESQQADGFSLAQLANGFPSLVAGGGSTYCGCDVPDGQGWESEPAEVVHVSPEQMPRPSTGSSASVDLWGVPPESVRVVKSFAEQISRLPRRGYREQ